VNEGEQLGFLTAYSHDPATSLEEVVLPDLEELASRAGPAIDNARRFQEARQLADLDGLTGLYNRRTFHETLAREVARAHRYDRRLALVLVDLDDFKTINDRIGHLAGDAVLADAAERMREVVRSADVPCRIGGDEFAVILPEASLVDGQGLFARIQATMRSRPLSHGVNLGLSAGIAELRPNDDSLVLFERADAALYRAKDAGKGTSVAEERPLTSLGETGSGDGDA
jgi:diguanylate cyclase (GGDEF)-like protein